jgi:hypothetical protein
MPNTIRIKRRLAGGSAGAPSSLQNAELAFNEQDSILYYGVGTGGAGGSATSILAISGPGAFATLGTAQTVTGNKTFSGTVALGTSASATTPATSDNSTTVATTAYVKSQGYGVGSVTSVGLSLPSFITVSNSPVTGSGTLTGALASQTANTIFAAPDGVAGAPTFRALSAVDIPVHTSAKISDFDTQVRTSRLDQMAAPTAAVSLNSQRITNVSAPLLPTDAATKQYADSIAQSLNIHGAAQYATTASVAYTYVSGGTTLTITTITGTDTITFSANHNLDINSQIRTGNTTTGTGLTANTTYYVTSIPATNQVKVSSVFGGANATLTNGTGLSIIVLGNPGLGATLTGCPNTLDGSATFTGGERILVKNHSTSAYNGVYSVTTVGTGANGVWTRTTDFDNSPTGEITQGDYVFIAAGTANGGTAYVQTAAAPIRLGVTTAGYSAFTGDTISFTQFSSAGGGVTSFSAGTTGLTPSTGTTGVVTLAGILAAANGGTGVSNSNTITLGGNISTAGALTLSGAFATTLTVTGATSVTLPTSGIVLSDASTVDGGTF